MDIDFQAFYQKSRINEWRKVYIDYRLLDEMTVTFKLQTPSPSKQQVVPIEEGDTNMLGGLQQLNEQFIELFRDEMKKSNDFFLHQMKCVEQKFIKLAWNLHQLNQQYSQHIKQKQKEYFILRESTQNLYKEAYLLQCFANLNKQAAIKIRQSYFIRADRLLDYMQYFNEIQEFQKDLYIFHESKELQEVIYKVKRMYLHNFSQGDYVRGKQVLKAQVSEVALSVKNIFQFGIFMGLTICLIFLIYINQNYIAINHNDQYDLYFPMFRGIGLFLFYFWLLSLNVYVWNKSHINYKQIYGFNFHYSNLNHILRRVSLFTLIYLIILLVSLFKEIDDYQDKDDPNKSVPVSIIDIFWFKPQMGPLILYCIILVYLIVPLRVFNYRGRIYFWRLVGGMLMVSCKRISFPVIWSIAQFLALTGPVKDVYYTVCFYTAYWEGSAFEEKECANPKNITPNLIISLIPTTMMLIVQVRQGRAKGKFFGTDQSLNFYRLCWSMSTTIVSYLSKFWGVLFNVWIGMALLNAIFAYYWDVCKAWGFFQPNTKYRFLRRQLAYDKPRYYYAALLLNIPLRLSWALSISPDQFDIWSPFFTMMLSALQIVRIFIWNFMRVEKEHVTNIGEFRIVPPIDFPYDFAKLLKINQNYENFHESQHSINTQESILEVFDKSYDFDILQQSVQQDMKQFIRQSTSVKLEQSQKKKIKQLINDIKQVV